MNFLLYLVISLKICFGQEVTGFIKINNFSAPIESDSCVITEIPSGWHRIQIVMYGYRTIDTTMKIKKSDTLLYIKPEAYTVDSIISTPKISVRSFMSVDNDIFAIQPMPLIQDPVLFVKNLPFVVNFREISANDLDYSAALGTPGENMLTIEGIPVAAFPVYPHSFVPLPLVRKIRFYLLDIPEEIGWTASSHIDVRLPSGIDGSYAYLDPFGTISYSSGGPTESGGIQFYTLTPLIMLFSKGNGKIGHFDLFYKKISEKFLLTSFGLGEMVDLGGNYESENTKVLDLGVKLSTGNFTSYMSASFYDYKVQLEKLNERFLTLGFITGWKSLKWRINVIEEQVTYRSRVNAGNGGFDIESLYKRQAVAGRMWSILRVRSLTVIPFVDAVYQRMYFTGEKERDSLYLGPGLKFRMKSCLDFLIGTTNQFFKFFKEDKHFPRRHDINRRIFYALTGVNKRNGNFTIFYRKNLSDSLSGYGFYGRLIRKVGEKSGVAVSLWGMYSKKPARDYGINADLILTRRWGEGKYLVMRIVDRFPLYLTSGKREPGYFRMDLMFVRDLTIKSHNATVYAGVYNLFSGKQKVYDIKYPIPLLSLKVKL